MISHLFHVALYAPIYNLLIAIVDLTPGGDIGIAVILVTLIIKLILMPLSLQAATTQRRMRLIEPQLRAVRENYKDDKEQQAKAMMALYRDNNVKPFMSILTVFIQLPVVFALYFVFRKEPLLHVDLPLLYSFVHAPAAISPLFLGLVTISAHNILFALLAAAAQFVQARYTIPVPDKPAGTPSATDDMNRMMATQARVMLPVLIGVIAYFGSVAIALYFITSSIVALIQEALVRRAKHEPVAASIDEAVAAEHL